MDCTVSVCVPAGTLMIRYWPLACESVPMSRPSTKTWAALTGFPVAWSRTVPVTVCASSRLGAAIAKAMKANKVLRLTGYPLF